MGKYAYTKQTQILELSKEDIKNIKATILTVLPGKDLLKHVEK